MSWTVQDAYPLTLKSYLLIYDSYLISQWDHTAMLSQMVYNLNATVANALSSKKLLKPKTMFEFHPFRNKNEQDTGKRKISPKNFHVLRNIGQALVRR